jgi:dolichol-phosphate mannosyltransferase
MKNAAELITIIIPAYNEKELVGSSVESAATAARQAGIPFEIIVVDDCSSDGTAEIADALAREHDFVRVIHNTTNLGLGGAYRAGLAAAEGEYVTWIAADDSQPAHSLTALYGEAGSSDMVIPYVTNPEVRPMSRRIISRLFTLSINLLFRLRVPYYNAPAIHRTKFVRAVGVETDSFGFQAEIVVKLIRAGMTMRFVGIEIVNRPKGRTKAFRLKNIFGVGLSIMGLLRSIYLAPKGIRAKLETETRCQSRN